jgi:hypothetical protein
MRRMRLPPAAKRRLNHWVSSLSGCKRSQPHASFYEDSFVKPPLIAALMGGTLWALREGR